jgi:hypothetical protein
MRIQNTRSLSSLGGNSPNWLHPSILAFNLLSALRDLIVNNFDFQSDTQVIRAFLVSLEQRSSPILEIFTLSLPHPCAGRHWNHHSKDFLPA